MNLSQVLDIVRSERVHDKIERSRGKKCKFCSTHLAVTVEEPTIVHIRNYVSNEVKCECVYSGKQYCSFCHRYQV